MSVVSTLLLTLFCFNLEAVEFVLFFSFLQIALTRVKKNAVIVETGIVLSSATDDILQKCQNTAPLCFNWPVVS